MSSGDLSFEQLEEELELEPQHFSDNLANAKESEQSELRSSYPVTHNRKYSLWGYLTCFLWTLFTSFIGCEFLAFKGSSSTDRRTIPEETVTANCSEQLIVKEETYSLEECFNLQEPKIDCMNCTETPTLIDTVSTTDSPPTIPPCWVNGFTEYSTQLFSPNQVDSNTNLTDSVPITFLNSYYTDVELGRIDQLTCDQLTLAVLKSVIPRNLSDSIDSPSVSARKMYAWTTPISVDDNDVSEITKNESADGLQLETEFLTFDKKLTHPGKLAMSDNSYSPLSPVTTESGPIADDPPSKSEQYEQFDLPDVDKQYQTLAWAIANLHTKDDLHAPCNSPTRRSRDKSPMSSINSIRFDRLSMPSLTPFDVYKHHDFQTNVSDSNFSKPKRSSSLKSNRTPPGTPGQKAVRFADAFGLDLTTERHVFNNDQPPHIPASAIFDLQLDTDESIAKLGAKQFVASFPHPGASPSFFRRVVNQTVCLEDVHIQMPRGVMTGNIRVRSLGFEKAVYVRITYNNWATSFDAPASYVHGSHDGVTDRFSFSVVFPDIMVPGDRAQFAVRYDANTGEHFWDNNYGQNYSVTCYAKATDLAGDGSWVHYL